MFRSRHLAALLATGSLSAAAVSAVLAGCGGDDSNPGIPADDSGSDQLSSPPADAGANVTTDATLPPDADAGSMTGADAADAADSASLGDACPAISVTAMSPSQGWNGVDVAVTISGSAFSGCTANDGGADAGDAGNSCSDRFVLVAPCAAVDGGADAGCADGGSASWPLTIVSTTSTGANAIVPAGGPLGGPYTLVDTQNGCGASLPNAFTILGATATISKVVPPYGWTGDDTPITITGAGFLSTPHGSVTVPAMSPAAQKLHSTAFVSATSITSIVPKGLTAGGPYDLAIVNPDETGGVLPAAFRVVSLPIPSIANLAPASLTTSQLAAANNVTLTGCNFRSPLTVSTLDASGVSVAQTAGTLTCNGAATCPGGTNVCTLQATIGGVATGAFVVRVTNTDQSTAGDYSALVVTNPSAKLSTGFVASGKALGTPRRSLATTSGRINEASRFLYAIGGETAAGVALDSLEVAPLDVYGTLGDWYPQRNKLTVARSGAGVVQSGKYVYAIGGTSTASGTGGAAPAGTPLASIDRAKILDLTDLPSAADPTTLSAGTLGAGTWYYRVSVVRDGTDPDNPGGEGLPSDEIVATLPVAGSAVLTWTAPTNALHIAKYRVYRSPAVNGASHTEQLLYETPNAATLTYTDDGGVAVQAQTPLDRGSTGVFVAQTSALVNARLDASAVVAADPTGQLYVYVTGGWGRCTGIATSQVMDCYDFATLSADGSTLGAFAEGTTHFGTARARHGAAVMSAADGITPWVGNADFVFVSGGIADTAPSKSVEYAVVLAGGQLGVWNPTSSQFAQKRDGSQLQVANGFLYAFLGGPGGAYTSSIDLNSASTETAATLTLGTSWSNATASTPVALGRMGVTLESAYFYVIGGTTNDADAVGTVYQVIY